MPTLLPERTVDDHEPAPERIPLTGADDVFDALSARTARELLAALHEEPATASDLAETLDTSLQNTAHHLLQLQDAGLVATVDTWYSEKGREMDVYAAAKHPLVLFAGDPDGDPSPRRAVTD